MQTEQLQKLSQMGIKEIEDFFDLADEMVDSIARAKEGDGKIDFPQDYLNFLNIPPKMINAFIGADLVDDEWADLDEEEAERLNQRLAKYHNNPRFGQLVKYLLLASVEVNALIQDRKQAA